MSEREPTLRDVLGALGELHEELGQVRIGLGDVRGQQVAQGRRLDAIDERLDEMGERLDGMDGRLDALTREVEIHERETRRERQELPGMIVAGVLAGIERSGYASVTDLRALQAEVAELKADMAELKRAAGQ